MTQLGKTSNLEKALSVLVQAVLIQSADAEAELQVHELHRNAVGEEF